MDYHGLFSTANVRRNFESTSIISVFFENFMLQGTFYGFRHIREPERQAL